MPRTDPDSRLEALTESRGGRLAIVLVFVLLAFAAGVGASHLTSTTDDYHITEGATIDAFDGPEITVGENVTIDRTWPVSNETVNLLPLAQFTGDDGTTATVSGFTDDWLRLDDLDVTAGTLTAVPDDDRPTVSVTGNATALEYRAYTPDDGAVDLRLTTSGDSTLTLTELPDSEYIVLLDSDGNQLDRATIEEGTATLTTDHSGDLYLETSDPQFSNPSPEDGAFVDQQTDIDLNITVDHPALDTGDAVDVTFYDASDDSVIGSDTLTAVGEASTTWSVELLGQHEWYVETDDSGVVHESAVYSFETPHNLTIYDEQTQEILKDLDDEVEVTFFGEDEIFTRTTDNGNVSLDGLQHGEVIIVRTNVEGYFPRTTVIRDLTTQHEVYLLNETATVVDITFELDDPTGQFDESDFVVVQRPLERDDGTTRWVTVSAGDFGADRAGAILEQDQRYRILVEDFEAGVTRNMGPIEPPSDRNIELQIEEREIGVPFIESEGINWRAALLERDDAPDNITVDYTDPLDETEWIRITVHERGNESVEIANETFDNPQTLTTTFDIPAEHANISAWVVTIEGERDGSHFEVSTVVNPGALMDFLPDWLTTVIAFVVTMVLGALLGGARADMGAIVAALVAGLFVWIGWLPTAVGAGTIAIAIFLAGLYRLVVFRRGVPHG